MKKLELENFGVVEISNVEMREIDGGSVPVVIWWLRFRKELVEGFNDGSGANCK